MLDDWQSIVALVGAILGAYAAVLWLGIIVWTYRDIRERTRDGWSQAVAALLGALHLPGLLLYLVLRPHETLAEAYERRLEAEALKQELGEQRRSCPSCQRPVKQDFLLCPHCRTRLQEPCSECGRALELSWIACPYCGAQGPQPAVAPTAPLAVDVSMPSAFPPSASPAPAQPAPAQPMPPPEAAPEAATAEEPTPAAEPSAPSPAARATKRTRSSPQTRSSS